MSDWRAMAEFDPSKPSLIHDWLNEATLEWKPGYRQHYERYAMLFDAGVVAWDGRLLDGWKPLLRSAK